MTVGKTMVNRLYGYGLEDMQKNTFSDDLIRLNGLDKRGFREWIFSSGMLFGSMEKWWGNGENRGKPHEGLDLHLFRGKSGHLCELGSTIKIPVMYDGEVVGIENDFLGQSVFVRHNISNVKNEWLYTIYGHTKPFSDVVIGRMLTAGEVFANISDASVKKTQAPPHLHISVVWVPESIVREGIDWKKLNDNCAVSFIDPLQIFDCKYVIYDVMRGK